MDSVEHRRSHEHHHHISPVAADAARVPVGAGCACHVGVQAMSEHEYSPDMIDSVLRLKDRAEKLRDKCLLAYYHQSYEHRVENVLRAIADIEHAASMFRRDVENRERDLAEQEAAE